MPKHPNEDRSSLRLSPIRSILTATAAIIAAVVVISTAAQGSYALWTDTEEVSPGVITTGSLTLLADPSGKFDNTVWDDMLPGDRRSQPLELHNEGAVPSDIFVSLSERPGLLTVAVIAGECPEDGIPETNALTVNDLELGAWDAEETKSVCIEVTMNPVAPESTRADDDLSFQLLFTAKQNVS